MLTLRSGGVIEYQAWVVYDGVVKMTMINIDADSRQTVGIRAASIEQFRVQQYNSATNIKVYIDE